MGQLSMTWERMKCQECLGMRCRLDLAAARGPLEFTLVAGFYNQVATESYIQHHVILFFE